MYFPYHYDLRGLQEYLINNLKHLEVIIPKIFK